MNRITVAFVVAAATAAFAAIVPPASAQGMPTTTVSYADLDLSSAAGMTTIERRIAGAADRVCGVSATVSDLGTRVAQAKCRKAAIADAMGTLQAKNAPVYASR